MIIPIIQPIITGGASGPYSAKDLLEATIFSISLLSFLMYWVLFWITISIEGGRKYAKTKAQFILQFFIPYYWWVILGYRGIKELIQNYKEIDN